MPSTVRTPTAKIIISGDVQKHGLRKRIREIATSPEFRLVGYIHTLTDYDRSVEVVCQGDKDKILLFIEKLKSLKTDSKLINSLVKIDEVTPLYLDEPYPTKYANFDIIRDDNEMGERLDEGIEQLIELRSETTGNFNTMNEKYHTISSTMTDLTKALIEDKQQMRELADKIIKTQEILTQYITSKK